MNDNERRAQLLKIIHNSPWIALSLGIIVIVFYNFVGYNLLYCLGMFVLYAALSPLLVKLHKTGQMRYVILYSVLGGLVFGVLGFKETPVANQIGAGIYLGIWGLFGVSVVYAVFRERILRYLSPASHGA